MSKLKNGIKNLFTSGTAAGRKVMVRMLADHPVEGKHYKANAVVSFPEALAKNLCELGAADSAQGAVDYCTKELGIDPVEHVAVVPVEAGA